MENKRSDFFEEGRTNKDQRRGRKSIGEDGGNQSATSSSSFLFFLLSFIKPNLLCPKKLDVAVYLGAVRVEMFQGLGKS